MAISNPFKSTPLAKALAAKAEELRFRELAQSAAADDHIAAAAAARAEATLAGTHAEAVESAIETLDAAGVSL
jgi:hypothetical protein